MTSRVPLSLLTIHAHPDDEASKGAPTCAHYAAAGLNTVLVCCTGGEEGDVNNKKLLEPGADFHGLDEQQTRDRLALVRPLELQRSVEIIGFTESVMLGYRDSGMKDSPANTHPDCFAQAPIDDATGRLVAIIRRVRPQVILTYSDDQRGYPHPDHLRVHDISVLAWQRAGSSGWYPDAGDPWQPLKMYYSVWSKARIVAVHEAMMRLRGRSPFEESWLNRPGQDHRITTRLEIGKYLWARTESLRAHATQVDPEEGWWFGLSDDELSEIHPWEEWVLAASHVGWPCAGTLEDDLFHGIPE